jgi:hypothetical protein
MTTPMFTLVVRRRVSTSGNPELFRSIDIAREDGPTGAVEVPRRMGRKVPGGKEIDLAESGVHVLASEFGRLAQLVRAPASHAGGPRFESASVHHLPSWGPFTSDAGCCWLLNRDVF